MTSSEDQIFPYYRSPESIRDEVFTRRIRGLDEDEVNEYLDLLADQVETSERERRDFRAENDRLQSENDRLRTELQDARSKVDDDDHAGDRVNEQVVQLLSQAQLVAEEMVEDVSRDARQRLGQARAQERQILEEAIQTAERTRREAEAMITRTVNGSVVSEPSTLAASAGEAEQVRSFARAAQAQMQSIMDTFASQVARLGDSASEGGFGLPAPPRNYPSSPHLNGWHNEGPRGGDQDPWGSV